MTELTTLNGSDLAVRGAGAMPVPAAASPFGLPQTFAEQMQFAEMVSKSDLVPKALQGKPENVFLVLQKAVGLQVSFDLALSQCHVIDNKVTPSAELLRILLRRAKHDFEIDPPSDKAARAVLTLAHRPHKPIEVEYTIAEAQTAGLTGKPVWKQHGKSMLVAAVTRRAIKWHCPEVAAGLDLGDDTIDALFEDDNASASPPRQVASERVDSSSRAAHATEVPADDARTEQAREVLSKAYSARTVTALTNLGKDARKGDLLEVVVGDAGQTLQQALMDRMAELESGADAPA